MIDIADALATSFDEVDCMDFYRDIFPAGSFEQKGVYEDGKYNGIAVSIAKGGDRTKRFTVTDELDAIVDMVSSDDFCLMSPISYVGKSRKSSNARFMYALAIDLDGIETLEQWQFFIRQIEHGHEMLSFVWGLPKPTYLVSSGTGLHIYYVFEKPVPMFKNIVEQLERLKRRLTWQAWTQGASSLHDNVQYESLFQGFRVVGTITKTGGRCRAFKTGDKVTVEYLNRFVPEEYRTKGFMYKSKLSLKEAQKKYPEWYQTRVVEKKPKNTWICKKDLYDWWIRTLSGGAEQGHRYWCIMTLATYAKKCGVSKEVLEKDAYGLIPLMNTKGDEFTEDDVLHALEAFSDSYITYPIDTIVNRTGIPIAKNKRNGRKQEQHIKIMNAIREIEHPDGAWRNKDGRPDKQKIVEEWRKSHPEGRKADCIRDTGLDKKTVYKWWDYIPADVVSVVDSNFDEVQYISENIVAECQRIAEKYNISEEEAYEIYKKDRNNVQLVRTSLKNDNLYSKDNQIIFSESEYLSLPMDFHDKMRKMGIRPIVLSDVDYEIEIAKQSLEVQNGKK